MKNRQKSEEILAFEDRLTLVQEAGYGPWKKQIKHKDRWMLLGEGYGVNNRMEGEIIKYHHEY
jgi:hypothetical protein